MYSTTSQPRPAMTVRGGEAVDISSVDHECTLPAIALWVQVGGNVKLDLADGSAVTLNAVPNAYLLVNVMFTKVYKTGTTATGMVALWG